MKRLSCALCAAALLVPVLLSGQTTRRFGQKLTPEKQIIHVLNRLTFGAHPGDAAEVRRIGLEKWTDKQLHPYRIPENPLLESRLQPLDTYYDTRMVMLGRRDPGVYLVEAVNGDLRAYTIAIVSDLSLINKTTPTGEMLIYAADRKTGAPREGVHRVARHRTVTRTVFGGANPPITVE